MDIGGLVTKKSLRSGKLVAIAVSSVVLLKQLTISIQKQFAIFLQPSSVSECRGRLRVVFMAVALILTMVFLGALAANGQIRGELSEDFDSGTGFDSNVIALAIQQDGKLLLGGSFNSYNGSSQSGIVRLNPDGTPDGFSVVLGGSADVESLLIDQSGRILAGGNFQTVDEKPYSRLVRLNSDGSTDLTFSSDATPTNGSVLDIQESQSGRILIAGSFTTVPGSSLRYLARFESDGTLDPGFETGLGLDSTVTEIVEQPDGKLIIAGGFTSVDGESRNRIARLNADGSLDESFQVGAGSNGLIESMLLQPDGKILIGGWMTQFNGLNVGYMARLLPTGLADPLFRARANSVVDFIERNAEGRTLIGGRFSSLNGIPVMRLGLLLPNGEIDLSVDQDAGFDGNALVAAFDQSGDVFVGGSFQNANDQPAARIAKLLGDTSVAGGEIEFAQMNYQTGEFAGQIDLEVVRDSAESAATVQFNTISDSADAFDYVTNSGTISFEAGESTKIVSVIIQDDLVDELTETFRVELSNNGGDSALGAVRSAEVTILDDDTLQLAGRLNTSIAERFVADGSVYHVEVTDNGAVFVAGAFSAIGGQNRNRIAKLEENGLPDTGFMEWVNFTGDVYALELSQTGDIYVGGNYDRVNGLAVNRLVRLDTGGMIDPGFNIGSGFNGYISRLAEQADGRLLVAGNFSQLNGVSAPYLTRLLPTGAPDPSFMFSDGPTSGVFALELLADGKIVIGGNFIAYDGVTRNRIARLNPDGTLDLSFDPGEGVNSTVNAVLAADGENVMVGGWFSTYNRWSSGYVSRVLPDGLVDTSFNGNVNGVVDSLHLDSLGRILVGGRFSAANGSPRSRLTRFLSDGAVDGSFDVGEGADDRINAIGTLPSGDVLVGGNFDEIDGKGQAFLAPLHGRSGTPGGQFEFSAESYLISETERNGEIDVVRDGDSLGIVSVPYSYNSSSATIDDYVEADGALVFSEGETTKTLSFTIVDDLFAEREESFEIVLEAPSGAAALGPRNRLEIRILDDDQIMGSGRVALEIENSGANGNVNAFGVAEDGGIYVGGQFSEIGGLNRGGLARFMPDGTIDDSFQSSVHVGGAVNVIYPLPDGKVLIGGNFSSVNSVPRTRLARLNQDGTLDESFFVGGGFNGAVNAIGRQSDGRLIVGGTFRVYDGNDSPRIARLFADGAFDQNFLVGEGASGEVMDLEIADDDRIIVTGAFASFDGVLFGRIVRLESSGNIDFSFNPGAGANGTIESVERIPGGGLFIGGRFTRFNNVPVDYVARLLPNGLVDTGFVGRANLRVESLFLEPDGMVVLGGRFTQFNGRPAERVVRMFPNGLTDGSFEQAIGLDGIVHAVASTSENRILVGGSFDAGGLQANRRFEVVESEVDGETAVLQLAAQHMEVEENEGFAVVRFVRSGDASVGVSLEYSLEEGLADDRDFSTTGGMVEFAPGMLEKAVEIPIFDDNSLESLIEDFTVSIVEVSENSQIGPVDLLKVSILDDEQEQGFAGEISRVFASNAGADGDVYAVATMSDGRIMVGGRFSTLGASNQNRIGRLNPDGSPDQTFVRGIYLDGDVNVIREDSDGSLLVGGNFTEANGASFNRLARFVSDGTLEPGFFIGDGFNSAVHDVLIQTDGQILVAGDFTQFNGASHNRIVRIDPNGSLDPSFNPGLGANNSIYAIAEDAEGVFLGGRFTTFDGIDQLRLVKLDHSGSLISSFDVGAGSNGTVNTMVVQPDGSLLLGGSFSSINGTSQAYLTRLLPDGVHDSSFSAAVNHYVEDIQLVTDGRIAIAGRFTLVGGESFSKVARLLPNGDPDMTYIGTGEIDGTVYSLALEDDLDMIFGGNFDQVGAVSSANVAKVEGEDGITLPVQILANPQTSTGDLGGSAGFMVEVFASPPIVYQWRRNGVNLPGETSPSLDFQNLGLFNAGNYDVVISNDAGTITSAPAALEFDLPELEFANSFSGRGLVEGITVVGTGDSANATKENGEQQHGGDSGGASVWLEWSAPATGIATISTEGSSFDTLLAIYDGQSLQTLEPVASDDDSGGFLTSRVEFNTLAGTSYQIAVDGYGGVGGAIVLSLGFEETSDLVPVIVEPPAGMTANVGESVSFLVVADGVDLSFQWYRDGDILDGETFETLSILDVQADDVGLYQVVISNASGQTAVSHPAALEIGTSQGSQSVSKFYGLFTGGVVAASVTANRFSKAGFTSVSAGVVGSQIFDNFGATTESGEPNHGGIIGGASKWFGIIPEMDGQLEVTTQGSDVEAVLAVYTGASLLDLELVAENSGVLEAGYSTVVFDAEPATPYLVAVDTPGGINGLISLNWRLFPFGRQMQIERFSVNGTTVSMKVVGASGQVVVRRSFDLADWSDIAVLDVIDETIMLDDEDAEGQPERYYMLRGF